MSEISEINGINSNRKISLQIRNSQNSISVNLANLFKVLFELNDQGDFETILEYVFLPSLTILRISSLFFSQVSLRSKYTLGIFLFRFNMI